jgi:hypothetical protein
MGSSGKLSSGSGKVALATATSPTTRLRVTRGCCHSLWLARIQVDVEMRKLLLEPTEQIGDRERAKPCDKPALGG